jgi:hypothetical protein
MKWQRQVQWQAKDTMGDFKQSSKLKVKSFIFCSIDKTAHKSQHEMAIIHPMVGPKTG